MTAHNKLADPRGRLTQVRQGRRVSGMFTSPSFTERNDAGNVIN